MKEMTEAKYIGADRQREGREEGEGEGEEEEEEGGREGEAGGGGVRGVFYFLTTVKARKKKEK